MTEKVGDVLIGSIMADSRREERSRILAGGPVAVDLAANHAPAYLRARGSERFVPV